MDDAEISNNLPAEKLCSNHTTHERYRKGTPMEHLIQGWRAKRREDIHRKVAASSAATSRMKYRVERDLEGKTVRPYSFHDHEPQQPTETPEDYKRRLSRDRARARRGVDAQTVRSWTDLSSLSPKEKSLHQRRLAKERKARSRQQQSRLSIDNETSAIQRALKDGDIEWGMF